MKILLIITKGDIGGAQSFILSLAEGLKLQGNEVVVAFGERGHLTEQLKEIGVKFFKLKNLRRSKNPLKMLAYIIELRRFVGKEGLDVVHFNSTNTLPGVLSIKLKKRKIKTIFTVHGLSILDENYQVNFFVKKLFKLYFHLFTRFIDKIVFVSKHNLEIAKNMSLISKGELIYNAISIKEDYFLLKEKARLELSRCINQGLQFDYVFGSVGRLAYQKNYIFLLKNWRDIKEIIPRAKLIIIGDGDKRKEYEKFIKSENLKDVFLPGEVKNAGRLVTAFDLFVLPSLYEGLSISLIESQFAKVPALASDVGGNKEIIGEINCYKLDDKDNFLAKIKEGVRYEDRRHLFDINKMVKEYIKIYEL